MDSAIKQKPICSCATPWKPTGSFGRKAGEPHNSANALHVHPPTAYRCLTASLLSGKRFMEVLKQLFEQHYRLAAEQVQPLQGQLGSSGRARSEERRVGKE